MSFKTLFSRLATNNKQFYYIQQLHKINYRTFSTLNCKYHHNYRKKQSNSVNLVFLTSLPAFLAYFKKSEDGEKPAESFLESILPAEISILLKKIPEENENSSDEMLKTVMKRTILCIQRKEFEKAEQMAHLALRMAQDMQHYDGITLCYDIMANLAYELNQHEKAEKLFVSVLQRILQKGVQEDDIQILHLSLKVGHLSELQNKLDDALTNYVWAIDKIEKKLKIEPGNNDLKELLGLANYFYGQFLIQKGHYNEAKQRLQTAYDIYIQTRGKKSPDFIEIANNLAVAYTQVNELDMAQLFIDEAIIHASAFPELIESGVYHANKGLILLKKGLIHDATQFCKHADKMANKTDNADGKEQAKYCLKQIQNFLDKSRKN